MRFFVRSSGWVVVVMLATSALAETCAPEREAYAMCLADAGDADSQSACRQVCWQQNYECMEGARQAHEECLSGCTWADPYCEQGCYDYFHWSRRWCAHRLASCVSACEADGCPWWCGPGCWFCVSGGCDGEVTP